MSIFTKLSPAWRTARSCGTGTDTLQINFGLSDFTGLTSLPQGIETIEFRGVFAFSGVTVSSTTNLLMAPGVTHVSGFSTLTAAGAGIYDLSGLTLDVRAYENTVDRNFGFLVFDP